ncbi:MAG: hypothetical protein P8X63_03825 [Desulfuromonadaceae bacterium]
MMNEFAQEFKKRKIRQWLITVFGLAWFVALGMLVIWSGIPVKEQGGMGPTPVGYVVTVVFVMLFIAPIMFLTHKNWRCPSCGATLGRSINPKKCPGCGQALS